MAGETRQFSWDRPLLYHGNLFPTVTMPVEDSNGNIANTPVFADVNGMYHSLDPNGNALPVILQHTLPEVTVTAPKKKAQRKLMTSLTDPRFEDIINKSLQDLSTLSNDNTQVNNVSHRRYNQHLDERASYGEKSHAAWDKAHPNAAAWRDALTAAPLAVAAWPFIAGAGEALAGSAAGQAVTSGLNFVANASRVKAAWPWLDAALTSYAGAEGVSDVRNGKFTPETAMDLMPFMQIFNPVSNKGKVLYNAGKELGKNIVSSTKNNMVGVAFNRYTGDRFFNSNLAKDNYLTENLQKSLPFMSEKEISSIYKNAFKNKDYKTGQTIRDWHFLNSAPLTKAQSNGAPILYYHGAPYGSFSIFDSSKLNNTIGGIAAVGEKGNFTTTDLQAAKNYAETLPFSGLRLTDSPLDGLVDLKGLRDRGDLLPFQYTTRHEVYPLYANVNKPATFDFEGNAWNAYPNPKELGRKWKLDTNHTFIDNGQVKSVDNTEVFTSRQDLQRRLTEMKAENYDFGKKVYKTVNRDGEWVDKPTKDRNHRKGEVNPSTGKWEYYPDKKSITRLESRRIKPTTNGVTEQAFDDGYDSVMINNVKDANPPEGVDNWPINELIFRNSNQAKLANPFTVNDEGKLISIFDRDNFSNPDIRYQEVVGKLENGTPWNVQNAQLGATYTKWFFNNDVLPRLRESRPMLEGTYLNRNSPYYGIFNLEKMPKVNARGMTTPLIRHDANGNPFTISMNKDDLSTLKDKIGGLIHESREDMINFHKGLYNSPATQEAYRYMESLRKAVDEKNEAKVQELLPRFYEMESRLIQADHLPYLTSKEQELIENAYKTPGSPQFKNSCNLNEKVAENTRFRSEISLMNKNVTGKELDKVIDEMSDEEILHILSSGDSYGLDYAKYIEENPKERRQMIMNIKKAMKNVGVYIGASVLGGQVIKANDEDPDFSRILINE